MESYTGSLIFRVVCISYNMGKRDLPDIYTEPEGRRPEGEGIYIRQIPIAHVINNLYH